MQSQPNLHLWGYLSAEPERLRPGRCTEPRAGHRRFLAEHHRAGAVCALRAGTGPAGLRYCVHMTVLFVCSIPPSPQHDWTSEPKKSVHHCPLVSGWKSDTEETSKQKKLNRGDCLGSDPTLPTTPEKVSKISLLFLWPFSLLLLLLLILLFDCFFFSFSSPFF